MESFLKEYRQKRRSSGPDHSANTTPAPTPSNSITSHPSDVHPLDATTTTDSLDWQTGQSLTPELLLHEGREELEKEENFFHIPELPIGRELVINILSTWGDRFYVGLTGIEVYTASGQLANVKRVSVLNGFSLHFTKPA